MNTRPLPHSLDSERIVLGSMMYSESACLGAREVLSAEDFMSPEHGNIFAALTEPLDAHALVNKLGCDERTGHYLLDLQSNVSSAYAWKTHAADVSRFAEHRRIITAGRDIEAIGHDGGTVGEAVSRLLEVEKDAGGSYPLAELLSARVASYANPQPYFVMPCTSVRCHFGDMSIVAGRPGTGKTAYVAALAYILSASHKVGFWTFEMTSGELADRVISHMTGVSTEHPAEGLSASERDVYSKHLAKDAARDLTVFECGGRGEGWLAASLALFAAKGGKVAVIDYLQIAYDFTKSGENADITRLSKMLRQTAKSHGLAIVGVSQFRRYEGADDGEKRITYPKMSDLRGSGSLEQDAANICLLFAYPPSATELGKSARVELRKRTRFAGDIEADTLIRLHWPKVRHGKTGVRSFAIFSGQTMRFEEVEEQW